MSNLSTLVILAIFATLAPSLTCCFSPISPPYMHYGKQFNQTATTTVDTTRTYYKWTIGNFSYVKMNDRLKSPLFTDNGVMWSLEVIPQSDFVTLELHYYAKNLTRSINIDMKPAFGGFPVTLQEIHPDNSTGTRLDLGDSIVYSFEKIFETKNLMNKVNVFHYDQTDDVSVTVEFYDPKPTYHTEMDTPKPIEPNQGGYAYPVSSAA